MRLNQFLKYLNYLIALLVVAAAGVIYWFAYRVLPQSSGQAKAPVSAPVTIRRDTQGVPHIDAANEDDLFFAQGYAVAQDRLLQLELGRRLAAGELAEIVGARALDSDIEARRLRMRRLAAMHAAAIPAADRAPLAAYARGVNHFIATHRDGLPVEFRLLGIDPAPWTVADSVVIALQMFRGMTNSYRGELNKLSLLVSPGADREKIDRLFPNRTGPSPQLGSNAWAIAGRHTRSGKPLLASDPHLALTLPSVWYQADLRAPGYHAAGVQLPGLPGVGIGHNEEIAWGITNLGFDVQDLYREPSGAAARIESEVVRIAGGAKAAFTGTLAPHGPVVSTEGPPLALRWTAAEPGLFAYPFVELNRARNWDEFRRALSRHPGPGFNFIYADRAGNIGWQVAGKLPIRKQTPGDVPQVVGAPEGGDWQGFIPFEDLPSVYNPPSGMVISANQNPFPADFPYPVAGGFDPRYRARQIEAMLSRGKQWEPAGMLRIQRDIYSGFSHFLAGQLVAAHRARGATNPALVEPVALLEKWNGQMEAERPEPLIATLAFQHLRKAMLERAAPGKKNAVAGGLDAGISTGVLEELLRARPREWFADFDQLLVQVLADAVEEGKRMQGAAPSAWRYGTYHTLRLEPPVITAVPYFGGWFNVKPLRLSGSNTTVRQVTRGVAPSMRFVADLSDWDKSMMNLPAGQSGQPFSAHRMDQWKPYWAGESLPMQFRQVHTEATLRLEPR